MDSDISSDERAERVEKWSTDRIEAELFEIERARATCVPAEER